MPKGVRRRFTHDQLSRLLPEIGKRNAVGGAKSIPRFHQVRWAYRYPSYSTHAAIRRLLPVASKPQTPVGRRGRRLSDVNPHYTYRVRSGRPGLTSRRLPQRLQTSSYLGGFDLNTN